MSEFFSTPPVLSDQATPSRGDNTIPLLRRARLVHFEAWLPRTEFRLQGPKGLPCPPLQEPPPLRSPGEVPKRTWERPWEQVQEPLGQAQQPLGWPRERSRERPRERPRGQLPLRGAEVPLRGEVPLWVRGRVQRRVQRRVLPPAHKAEQ